MVMEAMTIMETLYFIMTMLSSAVDEMVIALLRPYGTDYAGIHPPVFNMRMCISKLPALLPGLGLADHVTSQYIIWVRGRIGTTCQNTCTSIKVMPK